MYNHAPEGYVCPICLGIQGVESNATLIRQSDIVYKDKYLTAFISSFLIGQNAGHVVVVPNEHYENLFDLPKELGARIFKLKQRLATAMMVMYENCEGVMTLQNNGPASGQHAFHYHEHIFPRFEGDELHGNMTVKQEFPPEKRRVYADMIRAGLTGSPGSLIASHLRLGLAGKGNSPDHAKYDLRRIALCHKSKEILTYNLVPSVQRTLLKVVLQDFEAGEEFTRAQILDAVRKTHSYPEISTPLSVAQQLGLVEKLGRGLYRRTHIQIGVHHSP
jgi:histidine triad (HIT) family protein